MKKLLLFMIGMMLAFAAYGQSNLPPCQDYDLTKWSNCFGSYTYVHGDKYAGEWKDNKPDGQGTYTYANGQHYVEYVGELKDGQRNGQGTLTYADGRVLKGIWADNQFVGAEKINSQNQQTDSEEKAQKEELKRIKRATRFEEEMKRLNSQANVATGTGSTGTALNEANRQSKLPYCGGSYSTSWSNCFGTETFRSGSKYVGGYKDGLQNGQGIYTHFNGNKYLGEFEGGNFHGKGTYTYADGRVEEGIWVNNQLVRAEKLNLPNQQTDLALNEERRRLEADRQALAEQQRRFDEEKRNREQARQSSKLSLQATTTIPDANGTVIITVRTDTDTSSLKVNGEEQGGRPDGIYTIKKVARVGQDTNYVITAIDTNGNTDSTTITVARQAVSQSSNQAVFLKPENIKRVPTRDAVAIIIGIQNYKRVPKAEFANNDAKEFYEYAIRGLGIKPENIKLMVDEEADEVNIVKAFENWLPLQVNKAKTDVYVFYSGHGLPSNDGKSLYFLPHGVDKELLSRTAVGQAEIVSALVASKPKSVTMFIDACYSGQTRGGEVLLASAKPMALKADANAFPLNFTVITASANDQISSSSPELKHGIFSFYLMKGMEGDADGNKDGKITVGEMQEYLSDKVSRQAMSINRKQDTQLVGDPSRVLVGR